MPEVVWEVSNRCRVRAEDQGEKHRTARMSRLSGVCLALLVG